MDWGHSNLTDFDASDKSALLGRAFTRYPDALEAGAFPRVERSTGRSAVAWASIGSCRHHDQAKASGRQGLHRPIDRS